MAETEESEGEDTQVSADAQGDGGGALAVRDRYMTTGAVGTVLDLKNQAGLIQAAMREAMEPNVHYGLIPGAKKPSLYKPGAEYLRVLFRLRPSFRREKERFDGFLTITSNCTLVHIPTGDVLVEDAGGMCSNRESKYAFRQAERECPDCKQASIIRSNKKKAYFCIRDKGGCGHRFELTHQGLNDQEVGRVPNPDLADTENTVLKMADKRALVAAMLLATAASDTFTQDLEDFRDEGDVVVEGEVVEEGGTRPTKAQTAKGQAQDQASGAERGEAIAKRKAIKAHKSFRTEVHGPKLEAAGYSLKALGMIEAELGEEPDEAGLLEAQIRSMPNFNEADAAEALATKDVERLREYLNDLKALKAAAAEQG
jgi:hypothetical protein